VSVLRSNGKLKITQAPISGKMRARKCKENTKLPSFFFTVYKKALANEE